MPATHPQDSIAPATADVVRTFVAAWRYMSSQYPGSIQLQDGPVTVSLSQTNCAFLNIMTVDRPLADGPALRDAIGRARAHAERCPHDAMLLLCAEWLPDGAEEILADEGLEYALSMWGMAADRLEPPRRELPALDFRTVRDEATGLDLGRINADAYGMAHELFDVIGDVHRWSGRHFGIVGHEDGRAITSTMAYPLGEEIYIAFVATLPGLHGKGYAEAAMRRAIADAQEAAGDRRLWLHATEMGRPLYAAMGFATGARMDLHSFG